MKGVEIFIYIMQIDVIEIHIRKKMSRARINSDTTSWHWRSLITFLTVTVDEIYIAGSVYKCRKTFPS